MSQRPTASLGRRLLPALAMTTAASGLVALLDQPSSGAAVDAGSDAATDTAGAAVVVDPTVVVEPPVVSSTVPAVVEQPAPTAVAPVPTTQPQSAATTTPVATSGVCEGQTIDGETIETRWGPVQVEAVVSSSGQICNVDAIQSPDSHGRSVRINDRALPVLHTQVMEAQSPDINGVSGATITTRGYQRSLQSILDSVG
jgi:uncharacterized protein with FMN-binding domain